MYMLVNGLKVSLKSHLGLNVRKPVYGVCNQVGLKPHGSATETKYNLEIMHVACLVSEGLMED